MDSTFSKVSFGLDHEEYDIWSVFKCIFCNAQLAENLKILECLHMACNDCILEKNTDSRVQCVCQTVTSQLTECTITPSIPIEIQSCSENNCSEGSKRFCAECDQYYCDKCCEKHLRNNTNHKPDVMIDIVTLKKESPYTLCTSCEQKGAEVYCITCSAIICALCYLDLHHKHNYKILEKLVKKIKINLNKTLCELKKNGCYFDFILDQNKKQIENLKVKKKLAKEKIDMELDKLRKKVNERILELKNSLEKSIFDPYYKIEQNIQDLKNKNKYNLNLIEALLKHENVDMKLSKTVLDKVKSTSRDNLRDKCTLRCKNVKFSCDETYDNCVSAIKAVKIYSWDINSPYDHNLSEVNDIELSSNDCLMENIQSTNSYKKYFDTDSEIVSQLLNECVCCKQISEILIKCNRCNRHFHYDCHIPAILKNVELSKEWMCTICQDITKYSDQILYLQERNIMGNVPIHEFELKIIERILIELYCQNICDYNIRTCLNKGVYPKFYKKVVTCASLDNVKKRLESKQYKSLFHFLKDIKQIFVNALMYYPPSDPHYLAAVEVQNTFHSLITKWLPKFDITKLPQN